MELHKCYFCNRQAEYFDDQYIANETIWWCKDCLDDYYAFNDEYWCEHYEEMTDRQCAQCLAYKTCKAK